MVDRDFKVTVLLSVPEQAQLQALAEEEGVPGTQLIRALIKRAYVKRFGEAKPKPTAATIRGLFEDMFGRAHYTDANIAERMGVELDDLRAVLERLRKQRVVEVIVSHAEFGSKTWGPWGARGSREETLALAAKKGFDLDEPIVSADQP
jgi:hypothetical protein